MMKNVKKISLGVICIGLVALNYWTFSRQFDFYNILFFGILAFVATAVQFLLFITARKLVCVYKQKSVESGSSVVLRLLAKSLDYLIALFILSLIGVISTCLPRIRFTNIPVVCACLYLFFCDSVTKKGSLGKKILGLRLAVTKRPNKRCPLYASVVRNFCSALVAILLVALSGAESRHHAALNWLFLTLSIIAVLDLAYLKKTGLRFLDQKLGLMVSAEGANMNPRANQQR